MKKEIPAKSYLRFMAVNKILLGEPYPKSRDEILINKFGVFRKAIPALVRQVEKAVKMEIARLEKSDKVNTISVLGMVPKKKVIERAAKKNLMLNKEQMSLYLMGILDKLDSDGIDNPSLRTEVFKLLKNRRNNSKNNSD